MAKSVFQRFVENFFMETEQSRAEKNADHVRRKLEADAETSGVFSGAAIDCCVAYFSSASNTNTSW